MADEKNTSDNTLVADKENNTGQHRIQFILSPAMHRKLEELIEQTGLSTRAEVLRRAISIYAVLVEEEKAGAKVELVGPDSIRKRLIVM